MSLARAHMPSFLVRRARLVPLRGVAAPPHPVDVLVTDGVVTEVGPGSRAPRADPGVRRGRPLADTRAVGPARTPRPVDPRLAPARPDRPRSIEEALARVAHRLAEGPDIPIVGWGHRSASWARQPTVRELDDVTGLRPVVLISGDGHHAWINSVAMRGLRLPERDGVVSETEWFRVYPRLAELVGADGTSPDAYLHTMQQAAAKGVTGVVDLEFDQGVRDWPERELAGAALLHMRVGAYVDTLDDFLAAGVRTGDPMPGCGPLIRMGPLKIISDGSLNTRTAWCCTEYANGGGTGAAEHHHRRAAQHHGSGQRAPPRGRGARDRRRRRRAGAQGVRGHRGHGLHRARAADRARGRADDGTARRPRERAAGTPPRRPRPHGELLARPHRSGASPCAGCRTTGSSWPSGSDAPVSPLDPWLAIAAAVHRSADEREPWHAEQSLTVARGPGCEHRRLGHGRAGHPADLALLDADPLRAGSSLEQAAALRSMQVAATWVAGRRLTPSSETR